MTIRRAWCVVVLAVLTLAYGWILTERDDQLNRNFSPVDIHTTQTTFIDIDEPLTVIRCQEDEPCWVCESMGNRTCGTIPITK